MGSLAVSIYSDGYTTPNSPIQHATRAFVINIPGPHDLRDDDVVLFLDPRPGLLGRPASPIMVPCVNIDGEWHTMTAHEGFAFGGRFVHSGDSRFAEALRKLCPGGFGAVPLHDYSTSREARGAAERAALRDDARGAPVVADSDDDELAPAERQPGQVLG